MRTVFFSAAVILALVGCGNEGSGPLAGWGASQGGSSSGGGGSGSSGSTGSSGGPSSGGSSGGAAQADAGAWTPPPPPEAPQPGGFQLALAPLLDAQGCTECHHHGRPIDLTTYPFMAGSPSDAASQLAGSFGKNMPPAPRTAAPQSLIDQVNAWIAAGMKP